jgi:hypothetical protein
LLDLECLVRTLHLSCDRVQALQKLFESVNFLTVPFRDVGLS